MLFSVKSIFCVNSGLVLDWLNLFLIMDFIFHYLCMPSHFFFPIGLQSLWILPFLVSLKKKSYIVLSFYWNVFKLLRRSFIFLCLHFKLCWVRGGVGRGRTRPIISLGLIILVLHAPDNAHWHMRFSSLAGGKRQFPNPVWALRIPSGMFSPTFCNFLTWCGGKMAAL